MYVEETENLIFKNVTATGNSGSAICISHSNVTFVDSTLFKNNTGRSGGGIYSKLSSLSFQDSAVFHSNHASSGGAIYSAYGTISLSAKALFEDNTAGTDGGALCAVGTHVKISDKATFILNSAKNGGAIYFRNMATLLLVLHVNFSTLHNYASEYGGAIYHEDITIPRQCDHVTEHLDSGNDEIPYCFIQVPTIFRFVESSMHSFNNSAGIDASYLYGGLLDKCQMKTIEGLSYSASHLISVPYAWFRNTS